MLLHYTVTVSVSTNLVESRFLLLLFMSLSTDVYYGVCDSMVLLFFYVNETFGHVTATVPT